MTLPPTAPRLQNRFNWYRTQPGLRILLLTLAIISTLIFTGRSTAASTAGVESGSAPQALNSFQPIVSTQPNTDAIFPEASHEPGRGIVVTSTLWIRPFHSHGVLARPQPLQPVVAPVAEIAANFNPAAEPATVEAAPAAAEVVAATDPCHRAS
ncbi:MAG: hypothetical protein Kow0031_32250 [Anaerolineae bacterium]